MKKVNPFIIFDLEPDEQIKLITQDKETTKNVQSNRYYITSHGRVFSTMWNKPHELSILVSNEGYIRTRLRNINKENKSVQMGRLVLDYFGESKENISAFEANHLDYNPQNNNINNLNWLTPEENLKYSENNHVRKIDDSDIIDIFNRVNIFGENINDVAKLYGISEGSARCIAHGIGIYKEKHKKLGLSYKSNYHKLSHENVLEIFKVIESGKYTSEEIQNMFDISNQTYYDIKFCKNAYRYLISEYKITPMKSSRH